MMEADRNAEHLGAVTCVTAKPGHVVTRGRDWRRNGTQEEYDVGTIVGVVMPGGERVGQVSEKQIKAYETMDRLCVVQWATGMVLVSSIGYNNVYELQSICIGPIAATGLIRLSCALGASTSLSMNAAASATTGHGTKVQNPENSCQTWCDCKNTWLTSREQFYGSLQSLGWSSRDKERWFTKADGTVHYRPVSLGLKKNIRAMVGFADSGNSSLAYFRLPGMSENVFSIPSLCLIHRRTQSPLKY